MSSSVIKTEGLTRVFDGKTAVSGLTLAIDKGEIFGFLGPNGSGKTTTIRMLCGILPPSGGRAFVLGFDCYKEKEKFRGSIGYMSQKFSLYNDLTSRENLDFYAGIYSLSGSQKKESIERILEITQLNGYESYLAGTLSGGWRQRLALGCAIIHRPKVLFLDEPTSGVDPISKRIFWDIIYTLSQEGVTILVTTHSMDEAEHCDRIGFMFDGKLIQSGKKEFLKKSFPGSVIAIKSDDTISLIRKLKRDFGEEIKSYTFGDEVRLHIEKGQESLFSSCSYRNLTPTLEDVFVYLVDKEESHAHKI